MSKMEYKVLVGKSSHGNSRDLMVFTTAVSDARIMECSRTFSYYKKFNIETRQLTAHTDIDVEKYLQLHLDVYNTSNLLRRQEREIKAYHASG